MCITYQHGLKLLLAALQVLVPLPPLPQIPPALLARCWPVLGIRPLCLPYQVALCHWTVRLFRCWLQFIGTCLMHCKDFHLCLSRS